MFNYVRYSDGGIKRLSNVRSEVDTLTDFAQRLFTSQAAQTKKNAKGKVQDNNDTAKLPLDFSAFRSHKTIRETIAAIVPGMEDLETIDVAKQEFHVRNRLIHKPEFKRANGKAKFVVHDLPEFKHNNQFPMRLMSVRSEGQFNSIIYEQKDSYRQVDQRWAVLMNPKAIASLGVHAGDKVDITSAVGEMKAVTVYPFDLPDGDVMAYYPEANVLIGRDRDARSKTPAFKSVDVKLTPSI
jgi:anaerobic selenocysteine-containing dehydrogenase